MASTKSEDRSPSAPPVAQRDVMGYGLAALNWLAGSAVLGRLGLRK